MISTGLQVELPLGYYGRVAPRSSLAAKHSIDVGAGVVDSDYRGELKVILFNFSDQDFEVIYLFLLLLFFFFAKIVLNEQLQFWCRVVFVLIEAHSSVRKFPNFEKLLQVNIGDRIAQLICERIAHVDFVETNEELQATDRGAGGFGSTGK